MNVRQKGFTLLELLVGLAITGVISLAALGLIFYQLNGTAAIKTCVSASHELTNADRWIGQDVMMAENTNLIDGGKAENNLSLSWTDRYEFSNIPHTCNYSLDNGSLIRNYDGTEITVARNITYVEFSQNNNMLEVLLSCTPQTLEARTVDKTISVYFRTVEEATLQ
ncbi:type II secretion system protein J [Chloroflexota bacterium]